jgi:carboxylesterase
MNKTEPGPLPPMAYSRSLKAGQSETGKAPLGVLVLHGFTSDIHCVDPLVKPLDEEDLPYRLPILRGHGTRYEDMEGTSDRDWYEDAENALLDLLREVEKVVVVGLSMGGLVTLELAARHRDKVAGVVTVAAALRFADPLAGLMPVLSRFVRFLPSPNSYNDMELKKKENRNYPKFSTRAFAHLWRYSRKITKLLPSVDAPILILQSHKDQVVTPSSAQMIYDKVSLTDRDLMWFEASGHEMFLDSERDAVIETVMAFIRKIRASASGGP